MTVVLRLLITGCHSPGEVDGITPTPATGSDTEETAAPDTAVEEPVENGIRTPPAFEKSGELYRFVVLGDYGTGEKESAEVSVLVASLEPDFIVTVGDNNYPSGSADTIDINVGQFYQAWIGDYQGKYGPGSEENRFWPCPGNHDWGSLGLDPYMDYFSLPGNERYYDFRYGDLHFFCVDSDPSEPDGTTVDSPQASWLRDALASSDAAMQIVYMHHPPYSSGSHGDNEWMQWPWVSWGADMVLGGHDHIFERQVRDGVPFIVTGLGGYRSYSIQPPNAHSETSFNAEHGTTLIRVFPDSMLVEFWGVSGGMVDRFRMTTDQRLSPTRPLVHFNSDWHFSTIEPDASWADLDFDDSTWAEGPSPLGDLSGTPLSATKVWARQTFETPADLHRLTLELSAHGTTEIFINGTKLAGPISGSLSLLDPSMDAIQSGTNVLAMVSETETGPPFLAATLTATRGQTLIAKLESWQVQTEPPSRSWIMPGYNDSAWSVEPAPVSRPWEEDDSGLPSSPTTMWLRHSFTANTSTGITDLLLSIARSDAAIVYLNGHEVHRAGLTSGESMEAISAVDGPWVTSSLSTLVDASRLRDGTNTIAVMVTAASTESTGLFADLSLIGLTGP